MARAAIIDRKVPVLAVGGAIIKRDAWAALGDVRALLDRAEQIRDHARADVDAEVARARGEGIAAGREEGLKQIATDFVRSQVEMRALLIREQSRIVDLACAVVARIAPRLDAPELVSALVTEAAREMHAEQFLQVRVHPDALARVEADLESLREAHPGLEQIQLIGDAELDLRGCVLMSESGKIEAGLDEQLAALRSALRTAAETDPGTETP